MQVEYSAVGSLKSVLFVIVLKNKPLILNFFVF